MFKHADRILNDFLLCEESLLREREALPGGWVLAKDLKDLIQRTLATLETDLKDFDDEWSAIASHLHDNLDQLLKRLSDLIASFRLGLDGGSAPELPGDMLKAIADNVHLLLILLKEYPVYKISDKKLLRYILACLSEKLLIVPKRDVHSVQRLVTEFTHEEVVLALEYNTQSKPFFVVTLLDGKTSVHILKNDVSPEIYTLATLMRLLGMPHSKIDFRETDVDKIEDGLAWIQRRDGVQLSQIASLENTSEALVLAYLLGAASADGFVLGLVDRPFNIMIDLPLFHQIQDLHNLRDHIGKHNPVFHIDFETNTALSYKDYIQNQIVGTRGLFILLVHDLVEEAIFLQRSEHLKRFFCDGYLSELSLIQEQYNKNKGLIDPLLRASGLDYVTRRIQGADSYNLLFSEIERTIEKIRSVRHRFK